jgi:glycosyltransferase involved in cell wall biosynthesis
VRVLQVIHDYLPLHAAGSEIYTAHLCRALVDSGHDVAVFTCEEDRGAEQWTLREREHDGVPVFEGIYNRIYADVSEHWDDPQMGAVFAGVLDRWKPDLVHVQGLQFVGGVSALAAAAQRGVPVVMTLHEYWWLCPRAGLMYDLDGRACETATPADCARCVDVYPIDRGRWSDGRHGGDGSEGGNLTEGARAEAGGRDADGRPLPPPSGAFAELGDRRWFARALVGRERELAAAREHVGRFIAPSRFLLERYVAAGFPRERIVHADYGFPDPSDAAAAARAARTPRAPGAPVRAGFVGTLSDYKGVEVFARAVLALADTGAVHGRVHGHLDWFPDVAERLRAIAARCPEALELPGPFQPEERSRILADLDVLVVPSLWWENSPLTIHEAWQHGLPVFASDRGGMAELVGQGGGALFPPGDDAALAELLTRASRDPAWWESLAASIPAVRPIEEDVGLLERLASELTRS